MFACFGTLPRSTAWCGRSLKLLECGGQALADNGPAAVYGKIQVNDCLLKCVALAAAALEVAQQDANGAASAPQPICPCNAPCAMPAWNYSADSPGHDGVPCCDGRAQGTYFGKLGARHTTLSPLCCVVHAPLLTWSQTLMWWECGTEWTGRMCTGNRSRRLSSTFWARWSVDTCVGFPLPHVVFHVRCACGVRPWAVSATKQTSIKVVRGCKLEHTCIAACGGGTLTQTPL